MPVDPTSESNEVHHHQWTLLDGAIGDIHWIQWKYWMMTLHPMAASGGSIGTYGCNFMLYSVALSTKALLQHRYIKGGRGVQACYLQKHDITITQEVKGEGQDTCQHFAGGFESMRTMLPM